MVSGNVYQIVHAQSSSIADFQLIGAPTSDVGLIFQATANGASQSFSSSTGQLALSQHQIQQIQHKMFHI